MHDLTLKQMASAGLALMDFSLTLKFLTESVRSISKEEKENKKRGR